MRFVLTFLLGRKFRGKEGNGNSTAQNQNKHQIGRQVWAADEGLVVAKIISQLIQVYIAIGCVGILSAYRHVL